MAVKFDSLRSVQPTHLAGSWSRLRHILGDHTERTHKNAGALWSPVFYRPGATRSALGVQSVWCFVADLDGETLATIKPRLTKYTWHAYTTFSHTNDAEHWHLVIPLATDIPAHQWRAVWQHIHNEFGITGDPACSDASRIYFLPQHAPGSPYANETHSGVTYAPPITTNPLQRAEKRAHITPHPNHITSTVRVSGGYGMASEAWWHEPCDTSRYDELVGKERYRLMLKDFRKLCAELT